MLLRHLNDFANSRKLLDNLAFKPKAVRWIITLDEVGNLVGQGPVETEGEKRRGKAVRLPTDDSAQGGWRGGGVHGGRYYGCLRFGPEPGTTYVRKEAAGSG